MIRGDVHRATGRTGAAAFAYAFARDHFFRPIVTIRLYQRFGRGGVGRLLYPGIWLLHRWWCGAAGMDLPLRSRIGAALAVPHGWGMVVNELAEIGRNVTLFHGVTIGQGDQIDADGARTTRYPVIEDEVWIGPHAVIVGGVRIGRGSRILAGAVIVADVPPGTMMAGNPARAIKQDCSPDVPNRAPLDQA